MEAFSLENLQGLIELVTAWGLKVLGGVALLVVGIWVAKLVRNATRRGLAVSELDASLVGFIGSLVYYTVVALVAISVLGVVGIETASLITVLGASSLAIGLALQGSLSNFASGVMLLVFRPYRAGDYIEVGDNEGWVVEVGVFSTALDTVHDTRVVLPNSHVSELPIRNWSTNGRRRLDLAIELAVDSPIPEGRRAIEAMLREEPRVQQEPAPVVALTDFGDTAVTISVLPWCSPQDYWTLRHELPEKLKDAIEGAGCSLPTPARNVHVDRADA